MAKRIQYRTLDVEAVSAGQVLEKFEVESRIVVGVDVAKRHFVAALCATTGDSQLLLHFEHPRQTARFVALLAELRMAGRVVEAAMEPTGTYGDALRFQLGAQSIPVYRVSNKHVRDAAELFDSSPSKHDGKDASVVGWLHAHQRSKRWEELDPTRRRVRALVAQRDLYEEPLRVLIAQVEPLLARHFPELERFFDMSRRKTPYRLLETFGSPATLGQASILKLTEFIRKYARKAPSSEVVEELLDAARNTSGTAMIAEEVELLRRMATQVLHLMRLRDEVDKQIERTSSEIEAVKAMRPCLGAVTAAVIYAYLGDPASYQSAAALEKAAGLNLVESSSGTDPRARDEVPRHISKRGAGIARKYLFLAAMRLVHHDPVCKAWYQARRCFKAEERTKAVVAVERKLCRALFHVARGAPFDASKLFDCRRLGIEPLSTEAA